MSMKPTRAMTRDRLMTTPQPRQAPQGRVPKLAPGAPRAFTVKVSIHVGNAEVDAATERVAAAQAGRQPRLDTGGEKTDGPGRQTPRTRPDHVRGDARRVTIPIRRCGRRPPGVCPWPAPRWTALPC